MDLMTVDKLIELFVQDGITSTVKSEEDVMLKLDECNANNNFNEQYILLGELAALISSYMSAAVNADKKWPGILLENMHGYVISRMGEDQDNVPRKIHFVWIGGSITPTVMDYIKVWAKINPSYEINIWYDSNLLCLKKLSDIFNQMAGERYSKEDDRNNWADMMFRNRQLFTEFVLSRHPGFAGMTQVMNEFLVYIGRNVELRDDAIWQGPEPPDNIRIRDMKAEGILNHELYTVYMKEAVQTQNFAALSDIARLLVLKRFGGVYIDVDMLPAINQELINAFDAHDIAMQRPLIQAIFEATGEIPGYSTKELEQCEAKERMRQAVSGLDIRQIMMPFGDIRCRLMAYRVFYQDRGIINQLVAAHPESMMINMLLRQIGQNYGTMEGNYGAPPFVGRPLQDVTNGRAQIYAGVQKGRVADFLERCIGYYKTGLIREYRSTLAITGPTIYSSVIFDVTKFETGPCSQTRNKVDTRSEEYQCFGVPFSKLTVYTEEELRSSWAVR